MRIGVDIDEVLTPFTDQYLAFFNKYHKTTFTKEDFIHYDFPDIVGKPIEVCVATTKAWDDAHDGFAKLPPYPDALSALKQLKKDGHELFIVSARFSWYREVSKSWLEEHFPGIFSGVFFTSYRGFGGETKTKADLCKENRITLLIEDDPHYVAACRSLGISVILMEQPWNKNVKTTQHVRRIKTWREAVREVEKLGKKKNI
jgi:uncharacterized protein